MFVSPNELIAEAKEQMLDNREPQSTEDWGKILNFVAYNLESGFEESVCLIFRAIYDIPLTHEQVKYIAAFQAKKKKNGKD